MATNSSKWTAGVKEALEPVSVAKVVLQEMDEAWMDDDEITAVAKFEAALRIMNQAKMALALADLAEFERLMDAMPPRKDAA